MHGDERKTKLYQYNSASLASVAEYAKTLKVFDFIHPALHDNVISEMVWIQPETRASIGRQYPETKQDIPHIVVGIDSPLIQDVLAGKYAREKIIVDLDLDYFLWHLNEPKEILEKRWYQAGDTNKAINDILHHDIAIITALFTKAGVVTIATSPGYISQEQAIFLIHQLS